MAGKTRRPNLFIVGAAKCGTTSMHEYLVQHPEIFMAHWKEPHHFAKDLGGRFDWSVQDRNVYLELFKSATTEKYVGESSVGYLYSKVAATQLKEFCPEARIIIMLRDPVDAICSMFHQHVINGTETIFDLQEALDAEPRRMREAKPEFLPFAYWFYYVDTVLFTEQVKRFFDVFGRDAVHVIIFDELKADPRREYDKLIDWLGLPPFPEADLETRNPARPPRNYLIKRWLLKSPHLTKYLYRIFSPEIRRKLGDFTAAFTSSKSPKPVITPEAKIRLAKKLRPEVDSLEKLLGRSLPHWCSVDRPMRGETSGSRTHESVTSLEK